MNRPPGPIPTIDQIKDRFEHLTPGMVQDINALITRRILLLIEAAEQEERHTYESLLEKVADLKPH